VRGNVHAEGQEPERLLAARERIEVLLKQNGVLIDPHRRDTIANSLQSMVKDGLEVDDAVDQIVAILTASV